jgi:hypothetical protein
MEQNIWYENNITACGLLDNIMPHSAGDVVHIKALGQHIVILGSAQAALDLLHHRGSIYSDRHQAVMVNDL